MKGFIIFLLCVFSFGAFSQEKVLDQTGSLTYISNDNYYLRFPSTQTISVGDTIYAKKNESNTTEFSEESFEPLFVVNSKSSTTALCSIISGKTAELNVVVYTVKTKSRKTDKEPEITNPIVDSTKIEPTVNQIVKDTNATEKPENKERIFGRVTLSSDNIYSDANSFISRLGGRLSLNAMNIANSRFSFETYLSYQHYLRSENVKNAPNNFIGIYQLAFSYATPKQFKVSLGRTINQKIPSLGAVDGLNVEKQFKSVFVGLISGFRPNYRNFLVDFGLYQTGVYTGINLNKTKFQLVSTVGFIDQRNDWLTDRRFLATQHSISFNSKLNLFASAELDMFEKSADSVERNDLKLTSIFASLNYRLSRKFAVFLSYDNRQNIIFYQTNLDNLDFLLNQQVVRQGARIRFSFNLTKSIILGAGYHARLTKNEKTFDNIQGSIQVNRFPTKGGSLSYNYNLNQLDYLTSHIHALRFRQNLAKVDGSFSVYYRLIKYNYRISKSDNPFQHFAGVEFTKYMKWGMNIALNAEFYNQKFHDTYRLNIRLSKTFK